MHGMCGMVGVSDFSHTFSVGGVEAAVERGVDSGWMQLAVYGMFCMKL